MDLLDQVMSPARDLLHRVDETLAAAGAPEDHVIWPLLRRARALPGDVLESFGALRPAALLSAAADLRSRAEAYAEVRVDLGAAVTGCDWEGPAAEEFALRWRALAAHLGDRAAGADDTLAGRLAATASYVEELADWMATARRALARVLGDVLGCAEAVQLRAGPIPRGALFGPGSVDAATASAAAAIGARVLEAAVSQVAVGEEQHARWLERLGELPFRPATGMPGRSGGATRVTL